MSQHIPYWPSLLLLLASMFWPAEATGQAVRNVSDAVSCNNCRIDVTPVLRLDQAGDIPSGPDRVVRDSRGRYWLTFSNDPAMIYVSSGRYLMDLKRGGGPGEFQYPWSVTPVGDSVLVQDRGRGATVLGPRLEVGRTLPPTSLMGLIAPVVWPDSVLMNAQRMDIRGDANPFHVVSYSHAAEQVIRSFGAQGPASSDPRQRPNLQRVIALARDGRLWAAAPNRYQIQLWTLDGSLQQTLVREPSWFPREVPRMNLREPPPPHIRDLQATTDGLLWVLVSVAAPTWREGYPRLEPGVREVSPGAFAYDKLFATIVEIIDVPAGRVVARHNLNRYAVSWVGDGQVAVYDTSPDGQPFVEILRLSLRR